MVTSALKTSNMPWTMDKSKPNYCVLLLATCGETEIDCDIFRCQIPLYRWCHAAYLLLNSSSWFSDADNCLHCHWDGPQPLLFTLNPRLPPPPMLPARMLHSFTGPCHPTHSLPDPQQFLMSGTASGTSFLHAFSFGWTNNSTYMQLSVDCVPSNEQGFWKTKLRLL